LRLRRRHGAATAALPDVRRRQLARRREQTAMNNALIIGRLYLLRRSSGRRVLVPAVPRRAWLVLAGLTLVSFLLLLDDTAVAVVLPKIQGDLGLGLSGLEWVVNSYTITLAVLMLLAGKLADIHGRRRMFLGGLVLFALGSLVSGFAATGAMLIAARVIQGVGAAFVVPTSLAIIYDTFPEGRRGAALGIWSGVSATALGLGPLLGAGINQALGWKAIFLLNVPFAAVAFVVARLVLPESRDPHAARRIDVLGVLASGGALLALLFALTEANRIGWSSPVLVLLLAAAGLGFLWFVRIERRQPSPLLDLAVFRSRLFAGANVVILLATSVMCSLFFFLALYMQTVLGYSVLAAGVSLLPLTAMVVLVAPLAGRLSDRVGPGLIVPVGMALLAVALLLLSRVGLHSSVLSIAPALALAGVGIGLTTAPTTAAGLQAGSGAASGVAAGVQNTFRATGLSLGIALMGAISAAFGAGTLGRPQAFVDGFSTALKVNAGIAFLAAVIGALTLRSLRRKTDAVADQLPAGKAPPSQTPWIIPDAG
jgi:EmrB/QacA subfamily drug resistance transporter